MEEDHSQGCRRQFLAAASAIMLGSPCRARAHGGNRHAGPAVTPGKQQMPWGVRGELRAAKRTIEVRMLDTMRFVPDRITVRLDETVDFRIHNAGKLMHEFVVGTRRANEAHAALMTKFPDMEHDEPYMAHVAPGQTGRIVWTFNRKGRFEFACLIAGHYQAGMSGTIRVAPA